MNRKTFLKLGAASLTSLGAIPVWAQDTANEVDTETADAPEIIEMVLGAEDAPVTLIEYASYTCPHCASFHTNVFKKLKADYIDTGKVKFIFREVYFDRLGLWAGMIARCDGPVKYFGMSDLLLSRQSEWSRGESGAEIAQNLYKIGRMAGMTDENMEACLQDRAKAEALVAEFQKNSKADDVNSTPSLILNGEKMGNLSYKELSAKIDEIIG